MKQSVLISGGGIVGTFLGLELAARNIPFKIIERDLPEPSKFDDIRSLTLNSTTHDRLQALGVETASSAIQEMKVLDGLGTGSLSFTAQEAKLDYLAAVLNFSKLRNSLLQKVSSSMIHSKEITSFHAHQSGITGVLSDGSELEASLLVVAEGRNSKLADLIAPQKTQKNYNQIARTFLVQIHKFTPDQAIQVFHEQEIFALMPYKSGDSDHIFSVVWSVPGVMGAGESQDDVLADLAKFEKKLACKIKPISDILSFPLFAHHLDEYCDTGICVIADSAHSIHPLAGQGINLGLADASILAEEIEKGFNTGQNIGHISFLKKYELRRKAINATMLNGVDLIFKIFQQDNPYFRVLRNLGLNTIDNFTYLKKQFIFYASGIYKI
jgi:2-octaprenylphenol hydroxylase|tara:strand:- start:1538 stop:2686 length:1149 start_codon:yes stop_codon:yes gene_type:complete